MATKDCCHEDKKAVAVACRCARRSGVSECGRFVSERRRRHFCHFANQKIMVILVQQAENLPSTREGVFLHPRYFPCCTKITMILRNKTRASSCKKGPKGKCICDTLWANDDRVHVLEP